MKKKTKVKDNDFPKRVKPSANRETPHAINRRLKGKNQDNFNIQGDLPD